MKYGNVAKKKKKKKKPFYIAQVGCRYIRPEHLNETDKRKKYVELRKKNTIYNYNDRMWQFYLLPGIDLSQLSSKAMHLFCHVYFV